MKSVPLNVHAFQAKKKSVKNLKRRLTPQGRGVKAIPSKKARIESVSKNKSDNCEKNNNTPKKSENNNENHSNPKKRRFLEITDNEKEKLLATTDYKVRQEIIQKYGYSDFAIWFQEESFFNHWQVHCNGSGVPLYEINLAKRRKLREEKNCNNKIINKANPQIQVEEGIELTDIDWSKVEYRVSGLKVRCK